MSNRSHQWEKTRLTLIGRLKDRDDQQSWGTFVDLYWRRLYAVGLAEGLNDTEAKDAVQNTIVGLLKDIDKYDPARGRFTPWLLQRAKWRIKDQMRDRKYQSKHTESDDSDDREDTVNKLPDASAHPQDDLEREWQQYLFQMAVKNVEGQINPMHFQIFDLYALKNMAVEEVAAMAGMTCDAIYTIKCRVMARVTEEVKILQALAP